MIHVNLLNYTAPSPKTNHNPLRSFRKPVISTVRRHKRLLSVTLAILLSVTAATSLYHALRKPPQKRAINLSGLVRKPSVLETDLSTKIGETRFPPLHPFSIARSKKSWQEPDAFLLIAQDHTAYGLSKDDPAAYLLVFVVFNGKPYPLNF